MISLCLVRGHKLDGQIFKWQQIHEILVNKLSLVGRKLLEFNNLNFKLVFIGLQLQGCLLTSQAVRFKGKTLAPASFNGLHPSQTSHAS
jgi:hypothetical protein